jgi:predicted pyridoxine 5'-phosphate oxidase superfamily flavin-nucleotide-binding protein
MVFRATAHAAGRPQCSYKGGDPGFVRVLDDRTLVLPSYDGNGMFLTAGNLAANPPVALLFVDFAGRPPRRLRVNGDASLEPADAHGAQFSIRIHVTRVFPNCPRYVHRLARVERSPYVPRAGWTPPVPEWKRADWARDVLPR